MGSGGPAQTQTTTQNLPPELGYWASRYLNALGQMVLPGGGLTPAQSPLPYQAVAPMTPQQQQGMQLTSQETYGPGGAPSGGAAPSSQSLMQSIMASPYWQAQLAQNPYIAQAFSQPALNQVGQLYAGIG
jgi:hypothetical protein